MQQAVAAVNHMQKQRVVAVAANYMKAQQLVAAANQKKARQVGVVVAAGHYNVAAEPAG